MKLKRLRKAKDKEWLQPRMRKFIMACCDCGLVHWVDFRIVGAKVQMRASRARNYTAAERRKKRVVFKCK